MRSPRPLQVLPIGIIVWSESLGSFRPAVGKVGKSQAGANGFHRVRGRTKGEIKIGIAAGPGGFGAGSKTAEGTLR